MTRRGFLTACRRAKLTVRADDHEITVEGVRIVWHRTAPSNATAIVRVRDQYALHVVLSRHGAGWRLPKRTGFHSIPLHATIDPPMRLALCRHLWRRDRALLRARSRMLQAPRVGRVKVIGEG